MNKSLSVDSFLYGGMVLGLSILVHHFCPNAAATTLWFGIPGGALCALLGVLGLRGYPVRRWALATMTILSIVLVAQAIIGWLAVKAGVEAAKSAAMVLTLLWVFAVGQLANLIQNRSGLPFDAEPEDREPPRQDK